MGELFNNFLIVSGPFVAVLWAGILLERHLTRSARKRDGAAR